MADGRVEYEVRANTSHLQSDLNAANQIVRSAAQQTQNTVNEVSNAAGSSLDAMADAAEQTAETIGELGEAAEEASRGVDELGDNAGHTSHNVNDLGNNSETAAKKTEKLKDSVDKVKSSLNDAKETIGKYTAVAGGALAAVGTAAIKSAADAETAFAKVKTLLTDGTAFDEYQQSIKAASEATGVAFGDMAESVYSAISASVDQEFAVDFAQNAVKLAKGGFTETATAVDVLTTAINAYGMSADDATHISDVLITTQNLGKTTVDELAHSMGQTIPIANSAGVAIEELSTAYAVMTKNGVATAEAGTQIKAMLNELNASGTNVDKTLREVAGKSFSQLKAEGQTTADVLNTLKDYAESSGKQLSDLFGSVEAGAAALTLVKDGGADFANILGEMENSAGAAEKAYDTMANTVEERLNKLKNRFTLALTDMGEGLLPIVEKFADYIDDNFDEISETVGQLGEAVEQAAEFLLSLTKILWDNKEAVAAAVAGYVAFRTAMAVGAVIAEVVNAIKAMKAATEGATAAQEIMNAVCNANPYVLLASAIIGVVTALGTFAAVSGDALRDLQNAQETALNALNESIAATDAEMALLSDKVARYDELRNTEERTAGQEEELKALAEELQGVFGDNVEVVNSLTGEYNDLTGALDDYIEAQKRQAKAAAYSDYLKELYSQIAEAELQMQKNAEEHAKTIDTLNSIAGTEFNNGGIARAETFFYHERQTGLENFIRECEDKINDVSQKISETFEEAAESAESAGAKITNSNDDVISSNSDLASSFDDVTSSSADTKAQLDELDKSTQSLITQYGGLYDALKTLQNGGALTYDQMQSLIDIYPDLAEQISVTADGYSIEAQALDELGIALDEATRKAVEDEKTRTQAAINGARDRILAYNSEIAILYAHGEVEKAHEYEQKLRDARSELDTAEAHLNSLDTLPDYLASNKGKSSSSGGSGNSGGSSGERATSGKGGNADNETKFDSKYDTLKYMHTMGDVDDKEYYRRLKELRADYLEPDSKKWRTIDIELNAMETNARKAKDRQRDEERKAAQKAGEDAFDSIVEGLDDDLESGAKTNVQYWDAYEAAAKENLTEGTSKYDSAMKAVKNGKKSAREKDFENLRKNMEFKWKDADDPFSEDDYYKWLADNYLDYFDEDSDDAKSIKQELQNHSTNKQKSDLSELLSQKQYERDMDGSDAAKAQYYDWFENEYIPQLKEGSQEWRNANLELNNYKKGGKTSSASKSGKSGTIINIDSYIPTVWDSEAEADKKLQAALGLELAGNSNYAHNIEGDIDDISTVGTTVSTAPAAAESSKETTLADVVSAIQELAKSDENRQINLNVELKARELSIGTVAYKDINDITKMTGKSPLIGGS